MAIQFPNSAVTGQSFLADNGIEYVYDGNKWVGYGTSIPVTDHLQSGNVEVHLFSNGSVTFPSPNPVIFTMTFDRKNYVETQVKPRLSLTDDPWVLHGEYQYNSIGESELLVDSIFPTLINPGYTSGDAFTFDQTVHGIPGHILTIVLNDVAEPAGAGWTANISASQPPEYPSSIKSAGAIKITATDSSWVFGTTGNLVLPADGYILNSDMTVYGGTSGGGTIWTNPANGCLRAELSSTGFQAFTARSHLDLQDGGIWNIGSYQNYGTSIGNDEFDNQHDLSLRSGDATFITTNLRENGNHQWSFGTDGVTTFPAGGRISSTGKGGTILDGGNGNPTSLTNYYANGNYSSCVTGYSNGRLYITTYNDGGDNPSREWAFDNYGNLTLPPNGYILNSDLTVYGGTGGAGGVGATGPTGASITGPTGPVGPTGSGSSLPVNQTGWPTILTSSSDGQTVSWSQNSGLSFNGYSVFMSGAECSLNFQQGGSLFAQMIVNANVYNPQSVGNVKITSNKFSGPHDWTFGTDGNLTLPAGGEIHSAAGIGNVYINSNDGDNSHTWTFSKNGNLVLPANSYVLNSDLSVYGVSDYGKTVYTGWFQNANTVVTLDNITSRITAEGIMQVGTVYSENQITGTAWAWNGIRNKNTTFSSFSVGGTNWVLPGDWLNISETPLDNNFEVATVTVFGLGDGHLYRITYVGSTNGKWSVVAERIA